MEPPPLTQRPANKICVPVRVAHSTGGLWLWAVLDTGAGSALLSFRALQRLFPGRNLEFATLPEGLPDEQRSEHGVSGKSHSHGELFEYRLVTLHYKFGKRQPAIAIPTKIHTGEESYVVAGYSTLRLLGIVLDPANGGIVAGNGEDLVEASLPVVPAGPLTRAEVEHAVAHGNPGEWRVWLPVDISGSEEVITWPVLLDTGANRSAITMKLVKEVYPDIESWEELKREVPFYARPKKKLTPRRNAAGKLLVEPSVSVTTTIGDMTDDARAVRVYDPKGVRRLEDYCMGLEQVVYYGMRIDVARGVVTLKNGTEVQLVEKRGAMPVEVIQRRKARAEEKERERLEEERNRQEWEKREADFKRRWAEGTYFDNAQQPSKRRRGEGMEKD